MTVMVRIFRKRKEAVDLLERVLGEVLQDQNQTADENLMGDSLDEEWSYIEKSFVPR